MSTKDHQMTEDHSYNPFKASFYQQLYFFGTKKCYFHSSKSSLILKKIKNIFSGTNSKTKLILISYKY